MVYEICFPSMEIIRPAWGLRLERECRPSVDPRPWRPRRPGPCRL